MSAYGPDARPRSRPCDWYAQAAADVEIVWRSLLMVAIQCAAQGARICAGRAPAAVLDARAELTGARTLPGCELSNGKQVRGAFGAVYPIAERS